MALLVRDRRALLAACVGCGLAFALVATQALRPVPDALDGNVRQWVAGHQQSALAACAAWVSTVGGTRTMYAMAAIAAIVAWRSRSWSAVLALLLAPVLAKILFESVKQLVARPRPPGFGIITEPTFAFPSAHATASAAVCCTIAYVFWRDGLLSPRTACVLGVLIPLLIGLSRLYLDVHWATDVIGGWLAGAGIAALSALAYTSRSFSSHHHR